MPSFLNHFVSYDRHALLPQNLTVDDRLWPINATTHENQRRRYRLAKFVCQQIMRQDHQLSVVGLTGELAFKLTIIKQTLLTSLN